MHGVAGYAGTVMIPALRVRSRRIPDPGSLLAFADSQQPIAWLRDGEGYVAKGERWRVDAVGDDRFAQVQTAWSQLVAKAEVDDDVRVPGSGLVAFGAFAFDASSTRASSLIVPALVIGRVGDVHFLTEVTPASDIDESDAPVTAAIPTQQPFGDSAVCAFSPGVIDRQAHRAAVTAAIERITAGELAKVVIARDLVGELADDADRRSVIARLHREYPDTWTYCVDGLVGASPEMLGRVIGGAVTARVLAGTTPRGETDAADEAAASALAHSAKDLEEHDYAIRSALESIGAMQGMDAAGSDLDRALTASPEPFLLQLPNVWHLASDIRGQLPPGATVFDLIAALHPTAAVGGTPRAAAMRAIRELEGVDRGRYAGPVGWCSAAGDGEWVIALRGAQIAGNRVVAMAGGGIVASSDPQAEFAETLPKFRPIVSAFSPESSG